MNSAPFFGLDPFKGVPGTSSAGKGPKTPKLIYRFKFPAQVQPRGFLEPLLAAFKPEAGLSPEFVEPDEFSDRLEPLEAQPRGPKTSHP